MGIKRDIKDIAYGLILSICLFPMLLFYGIEDFKRKRRINKNFSKKN